MPRTPLVERAYQLAGSGKFTTVTQLRRALKHEGYAGIEPTMAGAAIRQQLRALMRRAEPVSVA